MTENLPIQEHQHPAPRRHTTALVVVALLVAVAVGAWLRGRHGGTDATGKAAADAGATDAAPPVAVETVPVLLRPMDATVAAQGLLTAGQGASARVAVLSAGRLTQVLVREGDRVAAGQLLALVDNRAALAGQRSAGAALTASLADARQADLATRATQSELANAVHQARLSLQSATGERAGALRQAAIALRSAESDSRKAQVGARAGDLTNAQQQARLALDAARLDRAASLQAASNALQQAQTDLDKLRAGARPQEVEQAQAAVAQAQATHDRAATEVERVQFLFDKGIKAKREMDDVKTALGVATAGLKSAQGQLSLVQAGARAEDVRAGELRVSGARDALAGVEKSGDAKVLQAQAAVQLARQNLAQAAQQRPEDVHGAALKVAAARDALRQAQQSGDARVAVASAALQAATQGQLQVAAKAEDARAKQALVAGKTADLSATQIAAASGALRAPLGGIVTKRNLNPGDMADPATPVVEITDPSALNLLANLAADHGAAVRAGMPVRVTTENAPGRVFAGQVASMGQIDPQTNLLTVRIAVPNSGGALKIGAFAHATIIVRTKPLALVVPRAVILARDGNSVVLVAGADGKAHQKTVVTGLEQNGLVEVVSGLQAGERVIRTGQYQLDDGAVVRVEGKPAPNGDAAPHS